MIVWAIDHVIIRYHGHVVIRSYDHMIIGSYDHVITWSCNHVIICWYDRMVIWSYDHGRMSCSQFFGRTERRTSASRDTHCEESASERKKQIAPPNLDKSIEKRIFETEQFLRKKIPNVIPPENELLQIFRNAFWQRLRLNGAMFEGDTAVQSLSPRIRIPSLIIIKLSY